MREELWQKLICTRSCTDHLFSAQIQPKTLPKHFFTSFMQLMHNGMRKLRVWSQLLVICLNTLPRPPWGHSMHFYDHAPRPPFNQITQQVCQSTGLGLGNPKKYIYICWMCPSEILEHPPKIPWPSPPPGPPQNWLFYALINSIRRQDSENVIYISIETL